MKNAVKLINELGRDRVKQNEPMSRHTYFKIGGLADMFYTAKSADELKKAFAASNSYDIPFYLLGSGSNVLVADDGIRGLVVKNEAQRIEVIGQRVIAESGSLLNLVAAAANRAGLSGLAVFISLPGTVGGAIYNNAHYRPERNEFIGNLLEEARLVSEDGELTVGREWFDFKYDYSNLQTVSGVVLEAVFKLKRGSRAELKEKARETLLRRNQKQPLGEACSGCIFKNPPGNMAGKLIDEAGLKGLSVGGARVSNKHANFIVNIGGATSRDVLELMSIVKDRVKDKFGVLLEPEIFLVGDS